MEYHMYAITISAHTFRKYESLIVMHLNNTRLQIPASIMSQFNKEPQVRNAISYFNSCMTQNVLAIDLTGLSRIKYTRLEMENITLGPCTFFMFCYRFLYFFLMSQVPTLCSFKDLEHKKTKVQGSRILKKVQAPIAKCEQSIRAQSYAFP